MPRVTLDTNVLVSATFWTGESFKIVEMIDKKQITCVLSKEIIGEYNEISRRKEIMDKVKRHGLIASKIIKQAIANSEMVKPRLRLRLVKDDPNDDKVIECALEGNSDYLISNDKHLLRLGKFEKVKIMTPKEFLSRI